MLNFKTALVKKSELIEDEESELFGYKFARTLEIRNDVLEEEKIEIKFELGLPMTFKLQNVLLHSSSSFIYIKIISYFL